MKTFVIGYVSSPYYDENGLKLKRVCASNKVSALLKYLNQYDEGWSIFEDDIESVSEIQRIVTRAGGAINIIEV